MRDLPKLRNHGSQRFGSGTLRTIRNDINFINRTLTVHLKIHMHEVGLFIAGIMGKYLTLCSSGIMEKYLTLCSSGIMGKYLTLCSFGIMGKYLTLCSCGIMGKYWPHFDANPGQLAEERRTFITNATCILFHWTTRGVLDNRKRGCIPI